MKDNPNHGNRRRPPDEAYEVKKKRSRDNYAETQLKLNPFWLHNKIIRDLVCLYGTGTEIPLSEFDKRGFDPQKYKSTSIKEGQKCFFYDKYFFIITKQKSITLWKI
jgi:hypothetical protein